MIQAIAIGIAVGDLYGAAWGFIAWGAVSLTCTMLFRLTGKCP
jgi:D-alanyl-lipoteichoic acid acyltransferase DltB (MBOAT superfamily)